LPASLRARLAFSFALVVAISLLVAGSSLVALLHGYSARLVEARLDDVAVVVLIQARGMFQRGETPAQVFDFLGEQADRLGVRILLLDRAARVIQETGQGASLIGQRLPLTNEAFVAPRQPLHGQFSSARDRVTYQYSAVPLGFPRRVGEAELLIVAQPEGSLLAALGSLAPRLAVAAGAGLLAGLLAAVLLARWLGRPLARLLAATQAMARGDYGQCLPAEGPRELVRLSQSFNEMASQIESSRAIVHRFLSTLSHELRTPLTAIRGFAQAVLDGSASGREEVQNAMRVVDREARRMQRLTAELLDLSRLQAGQVPMRREPLDLAALVRQTAEVLAARARELQVGLALELPPSLPVEGDADRLEQVFTNLLDNALKFTPAGADVRVCARFIGVAPSADGGGRRESRLFGRPRTARRRPSPQNGPAPYPCALVEVANPGPTIPSDDLPRIFELFYTGAQGRERGGTGLGLPIAREIARAHGGDLTAASAADLTTFRVLLPAAPVETPS
jgi:signal transduction histidine kinase